MKDLNKIKKRVAKPKKKKYVYFFLLPQVMCFCFNLKVAQHFFVKGFQECN